MGIDEGRHPVARVGERQVVLQAARTIALQSGDVAVKVVPDAALSVGQGWRQGRTGPDSVKKALRCLCVREGRSL